MTAPPAEVQDELRPRSRTPFSLGFRQPEEPETPEPTIPSPAASPEETEPAAAASEPASEYDELPDPTDSPAGTSSRASTPESEPSAGLTEFGRNAVIIATAQAHQYLGARTEGMRAVELYQADQDDAANIADPLVRIAERRDGVGEMSPDSKDLLAAMMGIAAYASKQVQKAAVAKKLDARLAGGLEHPQDPAVDL